MSTVLGIGILTVPEREPRLKILLKQLGLSQKHVANDLAHAGHVANWWSAVDIACSTPIDGDQKPTHALVIEDDAEPCLDFLDTVQTLVNLYPSRTIGFFTRSKTVTNSPVGKLVRVKDDVPTDLAVVYPVKWLENLRADYLKNISVYVRNKRRYGYGADEMRLELRPNKAVWATVPSLVEHGCPTMSTLGHRYPTNIATRFIGKNLSGLSVDWAKNR